MAKRGLSISTDLRLQLGPQPHPGQGIGLGPELSDQRIDLGGKGRVRGPLLGRDGLQVIDRASPQYPAGRLVEAQQLVGLGQDEMRSPTMIGVEVLRSGSGVIQRMFWLS